MAGKTDEVSAPCVPVKVFGVDGEELTIDIEDLFFAQYATMALFLKLGFDSEHIFFMQGARQRGMLSIPFYGVALKTQNKECVATTYPHDCIRMAAGTGHSVFCSPAIVTSRWPAYVVRANRKEPAFEAKLYQHQIRNILQMIAALQKKRIDIPVFAQLSTVLQ